MPTRGRLTNNSDEAEIGKLMSGDSVFVIPYFQRAYKWKPKRLRQLNADLLALVDETSDCHFLGAVIVHGRGSNPSDPTVYEVIDGQQRITTIYLYLCAIVKILAENGKLKEASGLFLKYLVINRDTALSSNFKLHSCKDDRTQLNNVLSDILANDKFRKAVKSFDPAFLPASGNDKGVVRNNYRSAQRFVRSQLEQGGIERIQSLYRKLLDSISVVQIDVWDPTNGPKIFDALNSRQEPMTIGDLVRNEIFAKVANENPAKLEQIDESYWRPFYEDFLRNKKNYFDAYFFPFGLIHDPNLKKSEVYGFLSDKWDKINDPKKIIAQLAIYQKPFMDITCGTNANKLPKKPAALLRNMFLLGAPGSTLPFLMQLSNAMAKKKVTEKNCCDTLEIVESFLVRRAICGHEPTGLHAVFKRLWKDVKSKPTKASVTSAIKKHSTVVWPSAADTSRAIMERPLYKARIAKYLLHEIDRTAGGDVPADIPWVEHVLPDNPVAGWFRIFTKAEHEAQKDLLANLIPLSAQMNQSIQNGMYSKKRPRIQKDSMYKSARVFASENKEWTPAGLVKRSKNLGKWAKQRWKY